MPWILLVGCCVYVGLGVEPPLRYRASAPVFFWGGDFLGRWVARPGGLVEYGAALLAQLDSRAWLGALIFGLEAGLLFVVTRLLLRRAGGVRAPVLAYAPSYALLLLQNHYDFPAHKLSIGLLLALGLALGYLILPCRGPGCRMVVFWLLAGLLNWVAGTLPCLLFVVLGGLHELSDRPLLCVGCWLAGLTIPLTAPWSGAAVGAGFRHWGVGFPFFFAGLLYLYFPLAVVALRLRATGPDRAEGTASSRQPKSPTAAFLAGGQGAALRHGLQLGLIVTGGALAFFTLDRGDKANLELACYAEQKQWGQALATVLRVGAQDAATRLTVNRALFHTGRLGSDLFTFRQVKGEDLLPDVKGGPGVSEPLGETLLELGQVNLAEHCVHEALELEGGRPWIYRQLVWINLLKDRPQAARIFLNRLRKIPFQRAWAERHLEALSRDPRGASDGDLARIRSLVVTSDDANYRLSTEALLEQLLQSNPKNRMAFEYLMAHYLLTRQLEELVQEMGRLEVLGYGEIPRHYEEAILLYQQINRGKPIELKGRRIRPETAQRFERLQAQLSRNPGQTAALESTLARDFGDTFWFYYLYGRTGGDSRAATQEPNVKRPTRNSQLSTLLER